ncbi:hypothetical protein JCM1841_004185 [Sporobolomyces salmonicolor]
MSKFVTREVEIPDDLNDDEHPGAVPSSWATARAPSFHSGRSGGSGGVTGPLGGPAGAGGASQPPLPALPDVLLDALAREPPPEPANNSAASSGTISGRMSFSMNRSSSFFDPNKVSPALPSLPPSSPLAVPYPSAPSSPSLATSSAGFSTNRTEVANTSMTLTRTFSRPDVFDHAGAASTSTAQRTARSSSGLSTSNSNDSLSPSDAGRSPHPAATGSKRNMFKSLAFGRPRSSLPPTGPLPPPPPQHGPSSSTGSSPWTRIAMDPTAASSDMPRLPTITDSPVVNARLPPPSSSPTVSRQPSRQQLATLAQRLSHSAREGDRWLLEAQAAGLGIGTAGPGGKRDGVDEEEGEDDEDGAVAAWGRIGEQYTRDLQRERVAEVDLEYDDDDDSDADIDLDGEPTGELQPGSESLADAHLSPEEGDFHDARQTQSPELSKPPALVPVPALIAIDTVSTAQPQADSRTDSSVAGESSFLRRRPAALHLLQQHIDDGRPRTAPLPRELGLPVVNAGAGGTVAEDEAIRNRSWSAGDLALRAGHGGGGEEDEELVRRLGAIDTNARGAERMPSPQDYHSPVSPVPVADFVVAVVGPRHVGKSTVVRRGLKRSVDKPVVLHEDEVGNRVTTTTTSFTLAGQRRTIEVLEIDMHLLKYNDEGVIWPDGLPQCEGAMLCYDSTDPAALSSLSILLKAFWTRGSDVPLIVLACKAVPSAPPPSSSSSGSQNATDPKEAAKVCNVYGAGIVTLDGGVDDPQRKTKECFNWIIRQIMDNRGEIRRPASAASTSLSGSRRGSVQHYAMTSKSPVTSAPSSASSSAFADRLHSPSGPQDRLIRSDSLGAGLGLSVVREAPVGRSEGEGEGEAHEGAAPAPELQQQHQLEPLSSPNSAAPTYESEAPTYATTEEREGEGEIDEGQPHQRKSAKTAALDLYFSRDDMIDKFLYAAVTGNDEQYVTLFLITYRRFARPYDVLEKLIERFEFVAGRLKTDPLLSRFAQMKICGVLSTWMQNYPGDFTSPTTFGVVQPFLESLLPRGATWVAHYALDLLPLLASISAQSDPDGAWALPDKPLTEVNLPTSTGDPVRPAPAPRRPSLAPSYDSTSSIAPSTYMQASGMHRAALSVPGSVGTADSSGPHASSLSPRPASEAGTLDTQDSSEQSQSFGGSTASLRSKNPTSSMLVDVSNAIMELREEDIAMQITRLAWKLFSGMTPRDLLRHVLAPRDPANPRVALRDSESNVMRSIAFINYLASWTSTMILVQSKLKMRARIMEKMLLVALALREQENFDSLMGVLAGLNSQPIFRLSETMALVTAKLDGDAGKQPRRSEQPDGDKNKLPKKLRSLNRLMAATKSFSAYRLALANSGMNMIPYLGVHLQDITVVNEIKSDLRDGKVNWSKFSQMGRSAAIVLDCARVAPALPVDRTIEKFIANVPIVDEERQYALSYAHQPRQSDKPVTTRSRLRTLAKSTFASASNNA